MPLDLGIIDPLTFDGWDKAVLEFEQASFFHSSHWARLLTGAYQFKPMYAAASENNRLAALIPVMEVRDIFGRKKGVSLPFSDFCLPLFREKAAFDKVFQFVVETGRANKWRSITIRGNAPFADDIPKADSYYRHVLPLKKNENELYKNFRDSTQRNIKKAIKSDVSVTFESTRDAVQWFYRLNCFSRKTHGLPPQPHFFFNRFFTEIIEKGHGEVALARYKGRVASASVFFYFGNIASYKYGASDAAMGATRANYLVMWEAIRRYNAKDFGLFCFGRTEKDHEGLLQFKNGWGAQQQTINNYAYDVKKAAFVRARLKTSGFHNTVFRHMPMPALKTTGFLLYKYMG
jgi:Acetyltransferase (GNAT) domain